MRWQDRERSTNVEDRRRASPGPVAMGGGIGTILLLVVMYFMGADPKALLDMAMQGGQEQGSTAPGAPGEEQNDEMKQFVSVVLADTEKVWNQQFQKMGEHYVEPTLVMFSGQVRSACGMASAATGPFYCPGDQKVYIDLAFFDELKQRFKAPGDFAQAYVIAHEIGHHVQKLLGITDQVDAMRGRISEAEYNQLSVRLELQADFLAGMWAHHAEKQWHILERGDMEEALNAATAIGDDRLQKQAQGYVVPESFTHGTSAQRVRWFRKGLETGDFAQGDTFKARDL
ncbi:MAG: neutral zinc metallopeptidase [Verrucomicrobiales bacterium]|nr:neutral zinc metallopeptidase [Verrucomicrobiales bacterium]MCP5559037.1 neutral zinc metallopeptidase [Verrucomicrobiaceae bacterium]